VKLKTLRDLGYDLKPSLTTVVSKRELKAEAVKWVKTCELGYSLEKRKHNIRDCKGCHRFVVFFNLTEEELKKQK